MGGILGWLKNVTGLSAAQTAWDAVTGFLATITDPALWESLGWLALGVMLIIVGGALWLNKSLGLTSHIPGVF